MPSPPRASIGDLFAPQLRGATVAILLTVALAAFEGLAVAAALPQVAADLGGIDLLPWVITSFLLTSGVATVAAGPLVDALGVQRVFKVAVATFALGGVAAGLTTTMPLMIIARLVQGAGAGATIAVGLAAVGLAFPSALVGRAFALNSAVWGAMGVAAPGLAAALLTVGSWRLIFLINLPLGVIALLVGSRALPAEPAAPGRVRVDVTGLVLVTAFTAALLVTVDAIGPVSVPAAAVTTVLAWLYLRHARAVDAPALKPRHLMTAPFGPMAWTVSLLLAGAFTMVAFVPLYVSGGRGAGAAITAWSVLFFTVGWTTGANVSSRALDRATEWSVIAVGVVLVVANAVLVGVLALVDAPLWTVFVALTAMGTGVGASTNAALTLLRAVADDDELGRATAAHQFLRNQGFAIGAALGGAVILLVVGRVVGDVERVRGLLAGDTAEASLTVGTALADGFAAAALTGAVVAASGVVPLLRLRRHLAPGGRR
ncbi:MAG: MFS transporter [Actinobacteria bacterium]|nr:MFS transporter [Actinomycetota bacterium]